MPHTEIITVHPVNSLCGYHEKAGELTKEHGFIEDAFYDSDETPESQVREFAQKLADANKEVVLIEWADSFPGKSWGVFSRDKR